MNASVMIASSAPVVRSNQPVCCGAGMVTIVSGAGGLHEQPGRDGGE
jgi:hypothetical protein